MWNFILENTICRLLHHDFIITGDGIMTVDDMVFPKSMLFCIKCGKKIKLDLACFNTNGLKQLTKQIKKGKKYIIIW